MQLPDDLPVEDARRLLISWAQPGRPVLAPLEQAAGRVLAEPVTAREPLPLFDNSAVDGYALISADTLTAERRSPALLRVTGEAAAGAGELPTVKPGTAARVYTGAPIPPGADAVVRQEWIWEADEGWIEIRRPVPLGDGIRRRGGEIEAGETACPAGTVLTPPVLGFLSSLGVARAPVFPKPQVAIILTGDELADPGQPLRPGQIRDANTFSLSAAVAGLQLHVAYRRRVEDDFAAVRQALKEAFSQADAVLVSGGVSVGERDYVKAAAKAIGVKTVFWGVRQRPGFPLYFGQLKGKALFGLPGNPVSSLVCFYEYVWPFLRRKMGFPYPWLRTVSARLASPVQKPAGRTHFLRGRLQFGFEQDPTVSIAAKQDSHMLQAFVEADCLAVIPESVESLDRGAAVRCHLLPWFGI